MRRIGDRPMTSTESWGSSWEAARWTCCAGAHHRSLLWRSGPAIWVWEAASPAGTALANCAKEL